MLYTRPQVGILVALAAALLVGLGAREWRAGFPALAERLERFDRDDPGATDPPRAFRPAGRASLGERTSEATAGEASSERDQPSRWPAPGQGLTPHAPSGPLDLNQAGMSELARLPGVGPSLARRIVEERERSGGFDSLDALRRVYGLGPRKLAALRDLVTVRPAEAAAAPDGPTDPFERPADALGSAPGDIGQSVTGDAADGEPSEPDDAREPDAKPDPN